MNAPFQPARADASQAGKDAVPPRPEEDASLEELLKLAGGGSGHRRLSFWLTLLALIALVGGGAAYWYSLGGTPAAQYVTQPIKRGELTVTVTATGSIEPTNQVDISSELSGTVRKVLVDYNSQVEIGDVLAELDTDKLQATLDSSRAKVLAAKAKIRDAEATLLETKRTLERKQSLVAKNYASVGDTDAAQAAYDRAQAAVDSARADLGVAEADMRLNETNIEKARIISPIKGVVLARDVEPGQTVASSLQAPVLFSIAEDLTKMELQVDVDEADVGQVKVGQMATFTVDAFPNREFPARIEELRFASEIVQGVVTYKAILSVDNSELLLRPGMTATAQINVQHVDNALLVPNAALRFSPPATDAGDDRSLLSKLLPGPRFRRRTQTDNTAARKVWVLRDGEPVAVAVEVGASDGRMTEVSGSDLKAGDRVITDQTTGAK